MLPLYLLFARTQSGASALRRLLGCALTAAALLPATAAAQRAPITQAIDISEDQLFGGAIGVKISASPPDPYTPAVLNGVAESGESDLRLKVDLRYRAPNQLGGKNAGEFVPYQRIRVRIVNLDAPAPDNEAVFDLAPAVGAAEGWHYASEVRLPPLAETADVLASRFTFELSCISLASMAVKSDALPASALFRPPTPTSFIALFEGEVDLSLARSLPRPPPPISGAAGVSAPEERALPTRRRGINRGPR
jgi:uncharacterized protein involved in high-affinity Fe2+ transport